jgi:nucleoside-diphosphate-sugar epimerase
MTTHLVVGAGPVGQHVAHVLAQRGHDVTVATRSGRETAVHGVRHVALDASDAQALTQAASGAEVIFNCVNPASYTDWAEQWPPMASAFLQAAKASGAVLAITGNLYPYGPVSVPMTPDLPDAATDTKGALRAQMWADALELHRQGAIRAVEVRGSDYVGPGVGDNGHVTRQLPALRKGKTLRVLGRADVPHTFTDVADMARTLVEAALDPSAHGRIWHAVSNEPRTQAQALADVADAMGVPLPKIKTIPSRMLRRLARVSPMMRELSDMTYQWDRPYVMDDSATRAHFGLEPLAWEQVAARCAGDA